IARHAELGQLLNQELATIPLRHRRGDLQKERQFARRRFDASNLKLDFTPRYLRDASGVFMAVAVEEANGVAGAKAADRGKMASLGPVQRERPRRERQVDVKSFRHLW